jgi:hypothetical protein
VSCVLNIQVFWDNKLNCWVWIVPKVCKDCSAFERKGNTLPVTQQLIPKYISITAVNTLNLDGMDFCLCRVSIQKYNYCMCAHEQAVSHLCHVPPIAVWVDRPRFGSHSYSVCCVTHLQCWSQTMTTTGHSLRRHLTFPLITQTP